MAEIDRFLNGLLEDKLLNLHTAAPCRVIAYDEASRRATVQPLFMAKEIGREPVARPLIEGVPVISRRIRDDAGIERMETPIFKAGDVVLVAFTERALEAQHLAGRMTYPAARRRHSLTDAVILGVIL